MGGGLKLVKIKKSILGSVHQKLSGGLMKKNPWSDPLINYSILRFFCYGDVGGGILLVFYLASSYNGFVRFHRNAFGVDLGSSPDNSNSIYMTH